MRVLCITAAMLFLVTASTLAKDPERTPVSLSCRVPVLDTVSGYLWEQTKDGVSIKLIPIAFEPAVVYHRTLKVKPKGLLSLSTGTSEKYIVTEEPVEYIYKPDTLTFQLHITNQLNTVLRMGGCIPSFMIDGKSQPIDKVTQDQLTSAIILPRGTLDLVIKGPKVLPDHVGDTTKSLLDTAKVIVFSIYDVTVAVDAANNPAKKATFEWIFSNTPRSLSGTFEKVVTEEKYEQADAQRLHDQWYLK